MKASIFLATTLGMVIAGTTLQGQATSPRIAEFGTAPEITLIAQAKISRAKPKVEPVKRERSRFTGSTLGLARLILACAIRVISGAVPNSAIRGEVA